MSSPALASPEKGSESMDISTSENRSSKGDVEPVSAVFLKVNPREVASLLHPKLEIHVSLSHVNPSYRQLELNI